MTLKIYNTLSREKETFVPIEPGKVRMYVCGPTVYSYIHIGNARPLIFFDVVRRYLEYSGYDVSFIVNLTDVDDKLIRQAEQMGISVREVADQFVAAFHEDKQVLGIPDAVHPRVMDHIPEIIAFIAGLVDKGYAYESGGDVYFRTAKFADYGKLSHQNTEELQFGIRIDVDERKEDPKDFVLWKAAKPGEIYWASPWGDGRPGWHIECSAMSKKYLGETLDIHGGGQDLQFPHHECELAQSEALHGKTFARYWMHNGYINMDNEKMSKSLGNVMNVRDLLKKTKPEAVRYFMLSVHYRNPLNFSAETILQAENAVERLTNSVGNLQHRLEAGHGGPIETELEQRLAQLKAQFAEKMDDDFNTADAITVMFDVVSETNRYLKRDDVSRASMEALLGLLQAMNGVLGVMPIAGEAELLDEEVESLIQERTEARQAKNWARADEIRDLLTERGIVLEDTPQGLRWRRK